MADYSETGLADADFAVLKPIKGSQAQKLRDNPIASRKIGIKSADQTINNDATLSNDADMTIAVTGGQRWLVHGELFVSVTGAVEDFQFSLVTPDTVNDTGLVWQTTNTWTGGATVTAPTPMYQSLNTAIAYNVTAAGSGEFTITFRAAITLDATPATGNIVVAWAQNVSNANNITMKQHSYLAGFYMDHT